MNKTSFLVRLSKNKIVLILLVIVLISSIIANALVTNYIFSFAPSHNIEAIELDEKSTESIPYIMLEPYDILAIFNENSVEINFGVFLEINELIKHYDTQNVQYGSNYYRLHFSFIDETDRVAPWSLLLLPYVFYLIFLISGVLIVVIFIVKIRLYFVNRQFLILGLYNNP